MILTSASPDTTVPAGSDDPLLVDLVGDSGPSVWVSVGVPLLSAALAAFTALVVLYFGGRRLRQQLEAGRSLERSKWLIEQRRKAYHDFVTAFDDLQLQISVNEFFDREKEAKSGDKVRRQVREYQKRAELASVANDVRIVGSPPMAELAVQLVRLSEDPISGRNYLAEKTTEIIRGRQMRRGERIVETVVDLAARELSEVDEAEMRAGTPIAADVEALLQTLPAAGTDRVTAAMQDLQSSLADAKAARTALHRAGGWLADGVDDAANQEGP